MADYRSLRKGEHCPVPRPGTSEYMHEILNALKAESHRTDSDDDRKTHME